MRNIVQLVQHLRPGGLENMVLNLKSASENGDGMWIISLEGDKGELLRRWPELKPYKHRILALNKAPGFDAGVVVELARWLLRLKAYTLHSHHIGPFIYGCLCQLLLSKGHQITHLHTVHDAWHIQGVKSRLIYRWMKSLCGVKLVADAHFVAEAFSSATQMTALTVVNNGIDTQKFTPGDAAKARRGLGLPQQACLLGCGARMVKGKGQHYLIEALAQLPAHYHLALAGSGPEEIELKVQSVALGLCDRVHFLGQISDMVSFYQSLDVFCLISAREGLPLAVLESLACGVPVVSTPVGAIPEVVNASNGRLLSALSANAVVNAVIELQRDGVNQAVSLPESYSLGHMTAQYDKLLA